MKVSRRGKGGERAATRQTRTKKWRLRSSYGQMAKKKRRRKYSDEDTTGGELVAKNWSPWDGDENVMRRNEWWDLASEWQQWDSDEKTAIEKQQWKNREQEMVIKSRWQIYSDARMAKKKQWWRIGDEKWQWSYDEKETVIMKRRRWNDDKVMAARNRKRNLCTWLSATKIRRRAVREAKKVWQ